jgi:monoamine oxidase
VYAFGVRPNDLRHVTVFRSGDEQYISGCDAAFRPGEVRQLGPWLPRAHGRVHFAGAERSSWPNNMEGALESGERAADEVIDSGCVTFPSASRLRG